MRHRVIAALAVVLFVGAQPTYVCALACLLGAHGTHAHNMSMMSGPSEDGGSGSDHAGSPTPCHHANFSAGAAGAVPHLSTVLAGSSTVALATPGSRVDSPSLSGPENAASIFLEHDTPPPRI
ncbi:MAG: hypothetical protein ACE5HQ_10230 [Gemmatimonadota bacterium]